MSARPRLTRRALLAGLAGTALAPRRAAAQGFAGLGTAAEGYALPDPARRLRFPADHGPHPDFRIEWWYLTAPLTGEDGQDYGVQWTLFRSALAPPDRQGFAAAQAYMGHAALTGAGLHRAAERLARGGIGQAGVRAAPFAAHIDDWRLAGPDFARRLDARASGPDWAWALELEATGPLVAHGANGYSVKSPGGQASHYYSQPFFAARGRLTLPGGREVAVTGPAWADREWSSQPLSEAQTGWDWFSLILDGGARLMGFALNQEGGKPFTAATWIEPDGRATAYPDGAFRARPGQRARVRGARLPVEWTVSLPARGLEATVTALNPAAVNDLTFRYWEGPVRVTGSHRGRGYLEMTGRL